MVRILRLELKVFWVLPLNNAQWWKPYQFSREESLSLLSYSSLTTVLDFWSFLSPHNDPTMLVPSMASISIRLCAQPPGLHPSLCQWSGSRPISCIYYKASTTRALQEYCMEKNPHAFNYFFILSRDMLIFFNVTNLAEKFIDVFSSYKRKDFQHRVRSFPRAAVPGLHCHLLCVDPPTGSTSHRNPCAESWRSLDIVWGGRCDCTTWISTSHYKDFIKMYPEQTGSVFKEDFFPYNLLTTY